MNNCYIIEKYLLNFIGDESCSNGKCCSYLNYWLNEKMKNSKESLTESVFDVYNKYIAFYNDSKPKKFCVSNNFFIRTDIFGKMKNLYDLYELYNTFKTNSTNIDKGCIELNTCVMHYNNIIRYCKPNDESKFCEALRNFKTILAPDKFIYINQCKKNFRQLKLKEPQDLPELDVQQVDFLFIQGNRESVRRGLLEGASFS